MSKKNSKQTINNINQLNLEIDYDELAKAIVKAQKQADEEAENNESETISFFEAAKHIIRNDSDTNGNLMSNSLALFLSFAFKGLAVITYLFSLVIFYTISYFSVQANWNSISIFSTNVFVVLFLLIVATFALLLCLLFWGMSNEIERERDRHYIVAVFAGIATFVAMVATIVTLILQLKK